MTAAAGNFRAAAKPKVTAGLKCPPEICPNAAIIRPSPRPKPAATPAGAIEPGRFTDAAMPLNPMKKNPKVPTISASNLLPIDGASNVLPPSVVVQCCLGWWRRRRTARACHGYGCAMTAKPGAPPPYSTRAVRLHRLPGGEERADRVAIEEPLELRIEGRPVAVTMRTPGHDEE